MKITKRALTAAVLLSCSCFLAPYYAHAEETGSSQEIDPEITHTPYYMELSVNGQKFANFEMFDKTTDPNGSYDEDNVLQQHRLLFPNEKEAITTSMKYIVDMVGSPADTLNMNLKLYDLVDANASAMSYTWLQLDENNEPKTQISDTQLTATYLGKMPYDADAGIAEITINDASNWYTAKFPVLPSNGTDSDYYGTITHEMFHAMGLGTILREVNSGSGDSVQTAYFFGTDPNEQAEDNNVVAMSNNREVTATSEQDTTIVFSKYEMGLRDAFGRVAYYEEQEDGDPVYYDGAQYGAEEPINPNAENPLAGVTGKLVSREIVSIDLEDYTNAEFPKENDKFYVIQGINNQPLTNGGVYFTGSHVQEVLNGASIAWPDATDSTLKPVSGLPINGYQSTNPADPPELSHIELQNSLMSHQSYRNWCTYMEAEIALLQDLGYNIDRSKYFGKSIYNSGEKDKETNSITYYNYTNNTAFNSDQMHGIGLHVYGSYVNVTQAADINAAGDYGIGIRVDGVGNKVTIDSNVSANGEGGNGLLVAYGKKHEITLNSGKTIEATGTDGVAARFDFGSNELGDKYGYRGSYINAEYKEPPQESGSEDDDDINDERRLANQSEIDPAQQIGWVMDTANMPEAIQGELVTNFNVSGTLKGKQAAIYISPNALVKNINLLSGASLEGDIISKWNPVPVEIASSSDSTSNDGTTSNSNGNAGAGYVGSNPGDSASSSEELPPYSIYPVLPQGEDGLTNLTFGGTAKETTLTEGSGDNLEYITETTFEADSDFNMTYSGKIDGINSLKMNIAGGTLDYSGEANVYNVTINEGATLKGKGKYTLNTAFEDYDAGTFTNNGAFDLGDGIATIDIKGDYLQNTTGNMLVDFNSDAGADLLNISGGKADLNGKLTLTPQVDYYFNGQKITIDVVNATEITNAIIDSGNNQKVIFNNISPVLNFSLNTDETNAGMLGEGKYVINVSRVEQGYQSVADDKISAGIGSALDSDAEKQKEETYVVSADKEALLSAIDFPLTVTKEPEEKKKVLNTNIKKLNPDVIGSNAQAVLETHVALNSLLSLTSLSNVGSFSNNVPIARLGGGLGPARNEAPKYNSWRNIVMPFSAYTDQHNGSNGYTNHNSGVIGAMERTFTNGLTHGYHAAINHQSTEDSDGRIKGEGIYLGTHASYAPADWNGWSVFGSARIGVEQMRSHRNVRIFAADGSLYHGVADGDWTGYSGSLNLGAALTKEHGVVKSGPFAGLNYSFAHRPTVHEDGGAIRTNLESATYDSLRTQLGYRLVTNPKALDSYDSTKWQAHASVAWNHELLGDNGRTNYQLVEFPGATVEDDIETYGRDSMSIAAGVIFNTPNRLDVGLTLGSDIYRKGGSSIYGKVNFEWKF